jgi:2-polyprenyl-3-methyl-5-hydroxy-6-metoxy-1,4-benzoquinol methylase
MDLIPEVFWLRLLRFRWACAASQAPDRALSFLLKVHSDLEQQIDLAAIRYDNGVHVKHRLTGYHDFFVERIRPGERVLDVGCGNGAVAYDVAERAGAFVRGIDLDPEKIAAARLSFSHPRVDYAVGDVVKDLACDHFDVVILSNVLEHLTNRSRFLSNLVQRVQPSRVLIRIPVFERDWRVPLRKELGLEWRSDATHETEHNLDEFSQEIHAAGLEIIHQDVKWGEIWAEVGKKL